MTITTITSREFNQDTGRAKRATRGGPVFITDRGRPSHVLLSIDDYRRLAPGGPSIVDALSGPAGVGAIDFDVPVDRSRPEPARFD